MEKIEFISVPQNVIIFYYFIILGAVVYTAVTYDNDTSGNIIYSIIGGNTNDDFNIDSTTGNITLGNELRPREILEYTLQLQANDSTNQGYLNLTLIVVTVPQLLFPAEPLNIEENTDTSGGSVVWICASQDLDGNANPDYSIVSQSVNGTFKLNNDKTKLVTTAEFDYEEIQSYEIVISVTDTSPLKLSSTATLTVLIEDLNDVAPNFTSPASKKIPENTDPGIVVYTTVTEDPDTFGSVTYEITGGNTNDDFSINATSGNITVVNLLNATATANYSLVIEADDTVNVASLTLLIELVPDGDECLSNPCQNNATCVDGIIEFTCACAPGYEGITCENDIDECEPHPCLNGATCEHDIDEYSCTCPEGFSGVNCEIDDDECESSPCQNGTCLDLINGYNCTCVPGYEGVNCEIDIQECDSNPCKNSVRCVDIVNGYECICLPGYTGDNCETECAANTYGINCNQSCACNEEGSISCDHVNGTCSCNAFYTGDRCELDIDECENNSTCSKPNEGCDNVRGGYNCSCLISFTRNATTDNCDPVTAEVTTAPVPAGKVSVSVKLVLDITLPDTVDFQVKDTFQRYAVEVEFQLRIIYTRRFGVVFFTIVIRNLRKGSLEVDYDVIVDDDKALEAAQANTDIATDPTGITIFDETAQPSAMEVNANPVPVGGQATDSLLCQTYEATAGKCTGDYACAVKDGNPGCQLKDTDDNLQLILGLGIGIPALFVALAVILLCVAYYNNKNKFLRRKFRHDYDDRSNELYERKIPVRANTGPPTWPFIASPEYPEYPQYPDYSRETSQRYLPSEDFHGQYDNRAQDRDSNNYTWDYLTTHLRSGEPFHIRRPKYEYK
ncbi:uncharacterized protein LOC128546249 isoform X2 [Mercenaria mercenaria]|uniref:uncharacterized protein LOC128546249 isoform X2 n=1 Tax=Mercenaria mercenaria TaxID=6596 RepID=UPI00234E49F6|nr:uncharacterized protein LOC128546249 isoform X2 [Mercenaria mercenaria]